MKKYLYISAIAIALTACTFLETENKVILKDGTKVELGVAIEQPAVHTSGAIEEGK